MSLKEEKITYIKKFALQQFKQYGFSKVTMDEIAKGTGTGKGTLYRYFPSKEELLMAAIQENIKELDYHLKNGLSKEQNPVKKLHSVFTVIATQLKHIDTHQLADIERNVPKAYEIIKQTREKLILGRLVQLLEEGKNAGFYRPDLDCNFTSKMLIGAADYLTKPEILLTIPNKSMVQIFSEIISTILHGCLVDHECIKEIPFLYPQP